MADLATLKELAQNFSILFVEDEDEIRKYIKSYLQKFFPKVESAKDGVEGVELYKQGSYDIVMTDIRMPRLSGLEMLKAIKEINPEQEAIVVSAYTEIEYFVDSIHLGVSGYIIKPVDFEQMNKTLLSSLTKLSLMRENKLYKEHLEEMVEERTRQKMELESEKYANFEKTLSSFVRMIENRDTYTGGHSERVANYCRLIAKKMNFSDEECTLIYDAGILHDIGKIATPDAILLKPGKLSNIEYKLIQEHVMVSYHILKDIPMYKKMADIIRYHHERYDGHGYPDGLKGDEIPMLSHIMIIADAFDAMTTNRIYKGRKSIAEAVEELKSLSKIQFHPDLVPAAAEVLKDIKLEESISQLPITQIEQERFAYFYHDQISTAFNQEYLSLILAENYTTHQYSCINILYTNNFAKYYKNFGWHKGDEFLRKISESIHENYPDAKLFRVHGDDFVLLNEEHIDVKVDIFNNLPWMLESKVNISNSHIDLRKQQISNLVELEELIYTYTKK